MTNIRVMISQPMNGLTPEVIEATKAKAVAGLTAMGYTVVDTYFKDEYFEAMRTEHPDVNVPVLFLSKSLEAMATCQAMYFCKGWEDARGCKIEHAVAKAYGLTILEGLF